MENLENSFQLGNSFQLENSFQLALHNGIEFAIDPNIQVDPKVENIDLLRIEIDSHS
jgi:hypothetical protein